MADSIEDIDFDVRKKGPQYIYDIDQATSNRYAQIQTGLPPLSQIEAAAAVSSAQILSQRPSYGAAVIEGIESIEMPKGFEFWAQVEAPPGYYEQRPVASAFAELFPSIPGEHLKACLDKLSQPLEQIISTVGETTEYVFEWEKVKEEEVLGKELATLKEFLVQSHTLSDIAISIDQRRKQYQQG